RVEGEWELPALHVVGVGGSAAMAGIAAVLLTRASLRRNDIRGGLVGLAFTVMAGLLTVHGLATPGFILEEYGRNATVGLAGVTAVPLAGVILAAAIAAPPAARARRWIVRGQAIGLGAVGAFGVAGL